MFSMLHIYSFFFLMIRRPPLSTRIEPLFPYTSLFRSVGKQITAVRDFGQFNRCPVNWVENVTGCGELRQRRLKHGKAEDVDLRVQVSICRCKWRSKCCRLRIDTIEVRAGAIAVEKLKLLGIGQTIDRKSTRLNSSH